MATITLTKVPSLKVLSTKVDVLGLLLAQISELSGRADEIKATLKNSGLSEVDGKLFRATVNSTVRWGLDSDLIKAEMGDTWVTSHSKTTPVTSVRVVGRKA